MRKFNVKTKKQKSGLMDYFNQMIGTKNADSFIIEPKYEALLKHVKVVSHTLNIFVKSTKHFHDQFKKSYREIVSFILSVNIMIRDHELKPTTEQFTTSNDLNSADLGSKYDPNLLNVHYRAIKENDVVKHFFKTLSNIKFALEEERKRSKDLLSDLDIKSRLKNNFIIESKKIDLRLFSFCSLDFKILYANIDKKLNEIILLSLHKIYMSCAAIYNIVTSPDINIDKFCESFIKHIDLLSKQVKGCDNAFKKIKGSIDLLRMKFNEYYKEFSASKNPGVIFELFIKDVAEKNKNSGKVMNEFSKLINTLRAKTPANMKNNSKIQEVFNMTDKLFKKSEELNKKDEDK